jgi:hypothetical protein
MIQNIKGMMLGIALCAGMICSTGSVLRVSAQDAVGAAVTPDSTACQVEPRTIESLTGVFAAATPTPRDEHPTSVTVPVGPPADTETQIAITEAVSELFACLNASDPLRFTNLLTDEGMVTMFPWLGDALASGEFAAQVASPVAVPVDQRQTILSVAGITQLAGGRAGAVVTFLDPSVADDGPQALHFIFVFDGDRWHLDQITGLTG